MTDSRNIFIQFDRELATYIGGEELKGVVTIVCPAPCEITQLAVLLQGETEIHWEDEEETLNLYEDYACHLNMKEDLTHLLEAIIANDLFELPKGTHQFPFIFRLPDNLPSSISTDYGSTSYQCVVQIDCMQPHLLLPGKEEKELLVEEPFAVIAGIPLGFHSSLEVPMQKEDRIELSGFFGGSEGSITIRLTLPKEEFAVGENIQPIVYVENQTTKHTIHSVGVGLRQNILLSAETKYESSPGRKTISQIIETANVGPIPHQFADEFTASLPIPSTIPPTQIGGLISISYEVVIVGDEHIQTDIAVPVLIALGSPMF